MHRVIANAPSDKRFVIDHRDGDGLDNRRANLRTATWRQNARNSRGAAGRRQSATRGVCKAKRAERPWRAYIYDSKGRFTHLGYFDSEEEAVGIRVKVEQEMLANLHSSVGVRMNLFGIPSRNNRWVPKPDSWDGRPMKGRGR